MNQDEIQRKSRIIEETLAQFGVPGRITEVRPGPTVTQFGVSPGYISRSGDSQRKVRVSQIASLADDLALALAARSLRVEAPVPGRSIVGVEVPNAEINLVGLRVVLESEAFQKCGKPLCVAIGLDVAGAPQVTDLAKMPHLLVAGTTGSGKSVFVKALAASLVMHNTPESLRLLTIDPKMVELTHLNGLPHLLGPTETDLESILAALRWVAHEMDRRYKLFATYVARNLDDYNTKIARKRKGSSDNEDESEILPRIVVLIDELADLMMSAPDETERTLTRIAQMARATGIHMVVATQRPSTDVVTGLIKANFPARVSFATTSIVDSRVIIDMPGAESLLGRGDMLFLPPEASSPVRVQGCFISDEELEAIKTFWQKEIGATPSKAPWKVIVERAGPESLRLDGQSKDADLLEKAIAYAQKRGKLSTSGLQRRMHISYPRAARIVEEMERMGIIGPQESAGRPRRVILGGEGS
jgi:S-DNA-T family DNA segregation ATPase FtsK/SpoIIIE